MKTCLFYSTVTHHKKVIGYVTIFDKLLFTGFRGIFENVLHLLMTYEVNTVLLYIILLVVKHYNVIYKAG